MRVQANIGRQDRIIRTIAGAVALVFAFFVPMERMATAILGVAGAILLLTALSGFSLLYFIIAIFREKILPWLRRIYPY